MLLSLITSRLGGWVVGGLIASAAIGYGLWKDQQALQIAADASKEISIANESTLKAVTALEVTEATLEDTKKAFNDIIARNAELQLEYNQISQERDKAIADINSYRTRWSNVSRNKPELLSRIINRATTKRVQLIESATCRTNCAAGGNGGKAIQPTPEAPNGNSPEVQ